MAKITDPLEKGWLKTVTLDVKADSGRMDILEALKLDGRKRMPGKIGVFKFPASSLTVSQVRRVVESFERTGESNHSSRGTLLRYLVAYCEAKNIPYRLTRAVAEGRPVGYHLERVAELQVPKVLVAPPLSPGLRDAIKKELDTLPNWGVLEKMWEGYDRKTAERLNEDDCGC